MSSPPPAVLVSNGAVSQLAPSSAASFLESTPGAYTTARGLLWWPRHLLRLADSARLLAHSHPHLLGLPQPRHIDFSIPSLVNPSLRIAVAEMRSRIPVTDKDDLAITALVRGGASGDGLDVFVHAGAYTPPVFGEAGARVAVAGKGRDAAAAKYAPWARIRKSMEKMRPPGVTELLLTNDGDQILEGSVTNFFVVCLKDEHQRDEPFSVQTLSQKFEVQTAPISDGVLPGIIRQIVIERCSKVQELQEVGKLSWNFMPSLRVVPFTRSGATSRLIVHSKGVALEEAIDDGVCHDIGIPVREVSPSWSKRDSWQEAFVTSSLRLIQHVESIQVPLLWEDIQSKTWSDISWTVKQFHGAGGITTQIQREILKRARTEEWDIYNLL